MNATSPTLPNFDLFVYKMFWIVQQASYTSTLFYSTLVYIVVLVSYEEYDCSFR